MLDPNKSNFWGSSTEFTQKFDVRDMYKQYKIIQKKYNFKISSDTRKGYNACNTDMQFLHADKKQNLISLSWEQEDTDEYRRQKGEKDSNFNIYKDQVKDSIGEYMYLSFRRLTFYLDPCCISEYNIHKKPEFILYEKFFTDSISGRPDLETTESYLISPKTLKQEFILREVI